MSDVLIRGVPKTLLDHLKQRAVSNRSSLQQELLSILEEAVRPHSLQSIETAKRIRKQLENSRRQFGDSTQLIREDRER
ncbi:hypothetical protein SY88_08195 [Clostridiales bacterium PH28_bin88]|nr:hypothetical protein SY88_08195 [Clostridiales bacterium PH28_bin88]